MSSARSENTNSFARRNGGASVAGKSGQEAWKAFLLLQTSPASGTVADLERIWLRKKGGTGETLNDLWNSYLNSKGFTSGTLRERKANFLKTGTQA